MSKIYGAVSITGTTGAMKSIDGDDLSDLDMCFTLDSGTLRIYQLDEDSALPESSPSVVAPTDNAGDKRWILQPMEADPFTTLANDATPSVLGGKNFLTGGTTTITDFDDGVTGQLIKVVAEHSVTITDGTNIFLNGSTNYVMAATDTLTLLCKADNKWYEVGRSDNT